MMRILKWSMGITGLLVLAVLGVMLYYFYSVLPSFNKPPENIIERTPLGAEIYEPYPAYAGLHPSLISRPTETFEFPIKLGEVGPSEPLFAGAKSYPFWCGKNKITNRQPIVDNYEGIGIPVFSVDAEGEPGDEIIGYSQDCLHTTDVAYYYLNKENGKFFPLEDDTPADQIDSLELQGVSRDFIVRLETGTINRHFYAIAVLKGEGETLDRPVGNLWNQRLIYQFRGGVGIGKRQGNLKSSDVLKRRKAQLQQGYAVIYSSANQTSNHYNMWLAEDTALRVKRQFESEYGKPIYTVGIGGSGGAIQQYLIAQNNPDILDGIIPLYSYPDMVTQTTYVLDCEPLEYFFDVQDRQNPRWTDWSQRVSVEGLSSTSSNLNYYQAMSSAASVLQGKLNGISQKLEGSSECVQSWRGLTPLVHNPNFVHFSRYFSPAIQKQTRWTHWEDLYEFYGRDENGYAQSTWDNVGLQYGLESLVEGKITVDEFLNINAKVGSWASPDKMKDEQFWFLQGKVWPIELSVWSHQNLNLPANPEQPAKRTEASLAAIEGAFRSGNVFAGKLEIPILDVRHYLDPQLDMHHSSASFMTRARMIKAQGNADNQIIWMSDPAYNPVDHAFAVMDDWLLNMKMHPEKSVVENRPYFAENTCFDKTGRIIARGDGVWNGAWNKQSAGACMSVYPSYPTSREIAGAPVDGDIFKCQRQSVTEAVGRGLYGGVDMRPHIEQLEAIFPEGVCDFTLPGLGRPKDLLQRAVVAKVEAITTEASNAEGTKEGPFKKEALTVLKTDSEKAHGEATTVEKQRSLEPVALSRLDNHDNSESVAVEAH